MSDTNPTLADLTSRLTSDGKIDTNIVEMLSETNEMLQDLTMVEATGITENVTTVRAGLPAVAWRRLNYGVQPSKSRTKQVTDSLGMLEAYAEVDKKLADLNGNKESWRLSEDAAYIESMNQAFQRALIYGDLTKDPSRIMGLAPRFCIPNSNKSKTRPENAVNVVDAGGSGLNLTSIWLICWSPNTVFCTYPKGLPGGLQSKDLGEVTLNDPDGGYYQGYRTHYEWNVGLVVRDWRYIVRIANIDIDTLKNDASSGAKLIDLMTDAEELLPNQAMGRPAFYCNRTIRSFLRKQIRDKANVNLTFENVSGKQVTTFDGIPVRRADALEVGEARIA